MMFWRHDEQKKGRAAGPRPAPPPRAAMSAREAYAVLGLPPGASADAVKQAHRRLMKLAHPDAGGSTHRAARLNAARDRLLG
jgi:DnaJ-domain-containing protein 1